MCHPGTTAESHQSDVAAWSRLRLRAPGIDPLRQPFDSRLVLDQWVALGHTSPAFCADLGGPLRVMEKRDDGLSERLWSAGWYQMAGHALIDYLW